MTEPNDQADLEENAQHIFALIAAFASLSQVLIQTKVIDGGALVEKLRSNLETMNTLKQMESADLLQQMITLFEGYAGSSE